MDIVLCRGDGLLQSCVLSKNMSELLNLIKNGSNVNSTNSFGESALYVASYYGENEFIRVLLQNGADVNCRSFDGNTPLHAAAYKGNIESYMLLMESGANAYIENGNKTTPSFLINDHLITNRLAPIHYNKNGSESYDLSMLRMQRLKSRKSDKRSLKTFFRKISVSSYGLFLHEQTDLSRYITSIPIIDASAFVAGEITPILDTTINFISTSSKLWKNLKVNIRRTDVVSLNNQAISTEIRSIFKEQLSRDLRVASRLQHPHLLSPLALAVDRTDTREVPGSDSLQVVYERPSLGSLFQCKQVLCAELTALSALTVCRQVAEALQFLHSFGLVHCNVTPHAVHMFAIDHAKLGNFEHCVYLGSNTSSPKPKTTSKASNEFDVLPTKSTVQTCARYTPLDHLANWLPPELFDHSLFGGPDRSTCCSTPSRKRVTLGEPTFVSDVYSLAKLLHYVLPSDTTDMLFSNAPVANVKMVLDAALQPRPEERLPLQQFHRLLIHLFWTEYDLSKSPIPRNIPVPMACPLRLCHHQHKPSRQSPATLPRSAMKSSTPILRNATPISIDASSARKKRDFLESADSGSKLHPNLSESTVATPSETQATQILYLSSEQDSTAKAAVSNTSEVAKHGPVLNKSSWLNAKPSRSPSIRHTNQTLSSQELSQSVPVSSIGKSSNPPLFSETNGVTKNVTNHASKLTSFMQTGMSSLFRPRRSRSLKLTRSDYVKMAAVPLVPEGVEVPPGLLPWREPSSPRSSVKPLTRSMTFSPAGRSLATACHPSKRSHTPVKPASHLTRVLPTYSESSAPVDLISYSSRLSRRSFGNKQPPETSPTADLHHRTCLFRSQSLCSLESRKRNATTQTNSLKLTSCVNTAVQTVIDSEHATKIPMECDSPISRAESTPKQRGDLVGRLIDLFEIQSSPRTANWKNVSNKHPWLSRVNLNFSSKRSVTPITRLQSNHNEMNPPLQNDPQRVITCPPGAQSAVTDSRSSFSKNTAKDGHCTSRIPALATTRNFLQTPVNSPIQPHTKQDLSQSLTDLKHAGDGFLFDVKHAHTDRHFPAVQPRTLPPPPSPLFLEDLTNKVLDTVRPESPPDEYFGFVTIPLRNCAIRGRIDQEAVQPSNATDQWNFYENECNSVVKMSDKENLPPNMNSLQMHHKSLPRAHQKANIF